MARLIKIRQMIKMTHLVAGVHFGVEGGGMVDNGKLRKKETPIVASLYKTDMRIDCD
jgi:hypothetical protein